jgi:hypothetical protein
MASTNIVKIKLVGERATEFATLCGNMEFKYNFQCQHCNIYLAITCSKYINRRFALAE